MAQYDYDLFTIGAGSGGVRASRVSASYGAKVAVAEERYLGGTCVNVGCIPRKLLRDSGVTIMDSHAEIVDPHTLVVDGKQITANYILVAVGSWPIVPKIPGAEHAITSNEAFYLPSLAEKVIIVGGGYVGVEFAGIFH